MSSGHSSCNQGAPSGKEKAHKHKQLFPVTARVGGGGSQPGGQGSPDRWQGVKSYVLCAEPKEHKRFCPGTRPGGSGTRPGGSVTRATEKLFMCQMFTYVPFQGPCPILPFLVFLEKGKENHQKIKDLLSLPNPLKSLEKKGKKKRSKTKKNKEILAGEQKKTRKGTLKKNKEKSLQGNQKKTRQSKEKNKRKGRTGYSQG